MWFRTLLSFYGELYKLSYHIAQFQHVVMSYSERQWQICGDFTLCQYLKITTSNLCFQKKNVKHLPLIESQFFSAPIHIKLGLIKHFVKFLNKAFKYLRSKLAKVDEGMFHRSLNSRKLWFNFTKFSKRGMGIS